MASLRPRGYLVVYGYASGPPDPVPLSLLNEGSFFLTRPTLHHYVATRAELAERAGAVFAMVAEDRVAAKEPIDGLPLRGEPVQHAL